MKSKLDVYTGIVNSKLAIVARILDARFSKSPIPDESFLRDCIAESGYCLSSLSHADEGLPRRLLSPIFETDDEKCASCRFDEVASFFSC